MKKRSLLAIAALLVFGLGAGTLAFQQTNNIASTAMSCCCCSGDSCPMKKKDASGKETASCCDNCSCCKGENSCSGDSCPMKKKGDSADKAKDKPATAGPEMKNVTYVQGEGCCCSCCNKGEEKKDKPTV